MSAYWQYLSDVCSVVELRARSDIQLESVTLKAGDKVDAPLIELASHEFASSNVEALFQSPEISADNWLETELTGFLSTVATLKNLYDSHKHLAFIKLVTCWAGRHPAVLFRLLMLKHCLPYEFERSLFCCWLAAFEAELCERDEEDAKSLLVCALCHDLGLLDVDQKFTRYDHDPRSTKDDINGYYSHTQFSAEFLSRTADISKRIVQGVQQHHEVLDGTGYPAGRAGRQLGEYGQLIHLYDTLYSIYSKTYKPLGKSLSDLVPVIEINAVTHFGQGAVRLISMLRSAPRSEVVFFKPTEFSKIQKETEAMANYIEQSVGVIQAFTAKVGFRHEDKTLFTLQNSFIHIALAYYKLRILHQQAMVADGLAEEGDYARLSKAVEDNFLSLREIIFHINKFLYRLKFYKSSCQHEQVLEHVESTISDLSNLTTKLVH